MKKKGNIIIIVILSILVISLGGYVIYDKVLGNNNSTSSVDNDVYDNIEEGNSVSTEGKILIKRNGVINYETVPSDIVGKYVNKNDNNEYIQLNQDGTAEVKFETGGGSAKTNNDMTFQLTYYSNNEFILELYVKSGPKPICTIMSGSNIWGDYKLAVLFETPGCNAGSYDFIKE